VGGAATGPIAMGSISYVVILLGGVQDTFLSQAIIDTPRNSNELLVGKSIKKQHIVSLFGIGLFAVR
jgi:hypothetical protein